MELKFGRKATREELEWSPESRLSPYETFLVAQWLQGALEYQDEAVVDVLSRLEAGVSELLLDTWFQTNCVQKSAAEGEAEID